MTVTRVAILGSNSHIAKSLIHNFLKSEGIDLHLFSTATDKLRIFLSGESEHNVSTPVIHHGYDDFARYDYDVLINCVGVGTVSKLQGDFSRYFTVCETYDNISISYLRDLRPDALYISFSSGAVYGRNNDAYFEEDACNCIPVNQVQKEDYYGITRLYTEAKHRSLSSLNIVDLRIFSYFSRFIDLSDRYFITEIINCILNNSCFITGTQSIVRDYLHPDDLFAVIRACMNMRDLNTAFDIVSAHPVEKFELLGFFAREHGLMYEVSSTYQSDSATGDKNIYCSRYDAVSEVGYIPKFSSINTIRQESEFLLPNSYLL